MLRWRSTWRVWRPSMQCPPTSYDLMHMATFSEQPCFSSEENNNDSENVFQSFIAEEKDYDINEDSHPPTRNISDYDSDGYSTCSEPWKDTWSAVNEHKVNTITIEFFYRPRTMTLLSILCLILIYTAFLRNDETTTASNITTGLLGISFLFLAIGLLVFPNGPFTRPHPAIWRLVFGASVLYFLLISFLLFQRYSDVMKMLHYLDPSLKKLEADSHTQVYTRQCDWTASNLWKHMDAFVPAHIFGWLAKAVIVRHNVLVWSVSILWELTEMFFSHILPNFEECWWDIIILDLLLCNGIGIYVGMKLIRWLEVRTFHWESFKDIKGTRGKIKRAVLQFTPEQVTYTRWLDPSNSFHRALAIFFFILLFLVTELNGFLTKHVLYIPSSHYLVTVRLIFIGVIALPTTRQYYSYVTDRTCDRLGTQAWVALAIALAELLFSIKFGMAIIPRPALLYIAGWLVLIGTVSVVLTFLFTMYSPTWGWRLLKKERVKKKKRSRDKKKEM